MIMLALSLSIFIVILYVSSNLVSTSSAQIGLDSAYRATENMRESSDFVYIHGHPSKTQVNIYIPPGIENVSIHNNNTLLLRVSAGEYYTDIYAVTRGKITGDLSNIEREGYYVMDFTSISDEFVNITVL